MERLRAWRSWGSNFLFGLAIIAFAGQGSHAVATEFLTSKHTSISGEIIRYTLSTVTIRTDFGGMLILPKTDVETVRYPMKDGSQIEGPLQSWDDGVYIIEVDGELVAAKDGERMPNVPVVKTTAPDVETSVETRDSIVDDRPATSSQSEIGPVEVSASAKATPESASALSFVITLSKEAPAKIVLLYTTINGTATAGQDYEAVKGVLVLPAGTTSSQLETPIIDDDDVEGDETFKLFLSAAPTMATIPEREIIATITDDDG